MDQELLRKLQLKEFEILKEIDRICKKHNIRWSLAYGSVLGAVRHGGFIPWDDDIDIYMIDEEYEKFKKVCKTDLDHDRFFLQTIETDKNSPSAWAKVRMNNTCSMDSAYKDKKMHWGICIDIFRLQYAPSDEKDIQKLIKLKWLYFSICQTSFERCPSLLKPIDMMKYLVRRGLRVTPFRKMVEQRIRAYSKDTDHKRMCDDAEMRVFPSDFFEKVTLVKFEDVELPCPFEPERYLEKVYGDWRKFPDRQDRYGHSGIIIDTERSYLEYQK